MSEFPPMSRGLPNPADRSYPYINLSTFHVLKGIYTGNSGFPVPENLGPVFENYARERNF